eukprot:s1828_g8.t1
MSVLECLKWHNFASSQQDVLTTEGKSGVPCFSGEVTKLAELKGPALQVARGLPLDKLSEEGGPSFLLKSLQSAFQSRVKQEARDLYQVGAQNGGILARQNGESMTSYVLRRRTWHDMMTDLDAGLKLPDGILAEQLLSNSGLSQDHQLLIRTALQGDMTFQKVSDELIAQHSRIHERESKGKGHQFRQPMFTKGGKSFGKKSGSWRSYHAEDDVSDSWENASQSLGGYEDYDLGSADYTTDDAGTYEAHEASEYDTASFQASDFFQAFESYAAMVEVGLDEHDQESLDLAAEVIQSESEAYYMRQKAKGSGHKGFSGGGPRNFQVHKSLNLEEKKAKLQAVKNRTMSLDPPPRSGETADEQLDRLIAQAAFRQHMNAPVFFDLAELENQPHDPQRPQYDSDERRRHLDLFLEVASRDHPDWEDANRERWSEFVPGHPLFSEGDRQNIARWQEKARLGLPEIPWQGPQPGPETVQPVPETPSASAGCQHKKVTTQGSNSRSRQVKCCDCGVILEKVKLEQPQKMETEHRGACEHKDKDFRGTTATTWKWVCKACGHQETGSKKPGQSGRQASSSQSVAAGLHLPVAPAGGGYASGGPRQAHGGPRQVMELMQLQADLHVEVGGDQLDRIYQRCRQYVYSTATRAVEANPDAQGHPVTAPAAASSVGTRHSAEGETRHESSSTTATGDDTVMVSGTHQGKTFGWIFQHEASYTKMMISKNQSERLRDPHLISYALYAEDRKRRGATSTAFMSQPQEDVEDEDYMLAVLDTGCNNTCHGDKWMEKYQQLIGRQLESQPADGRFKGVGGKVEVACKRVIPMQMLTVDQEKIPGSIASVEFAELQLHSYNGLPAMRLHPGEFQVGSVAMHVHEHEGVEEEKKKLPKAKVIDLEAMDDHVSVEGEEASTEVEEEELETGQERHLPLEEESIKVLSKGQKKQLQESLDEMDQQDSVPCENFQHKLFQTLSLAFPVEQVAEDREELGSLGAIHNSRDLEESPMKKRKVDHEEVQREESFEELTDEDKMLHQKERDRKAKWLKLSKEKRIAVRRLHAMMGHCSVATMTRMLKSSLASKGILDAVPHFRCQSCEERRKEDAPRSVRPTRSNAELKFNYEPAVDVFEAPFQLGTAERHGGILKQVMYKAIHSRQLEGAMDISVLCAEASRTKNALVNNGGYSPIQWVPGFTPDDLTTSLISHDGEEALGVHQELVDESEQPTSQEAFMRQLLIRQCAKKAFVQVDTSMRIRKAMLRRATPLRGPFRTGDLVCISRRGKWYGPARVLALEGKLVLWLVHSGVTILVAETACRPASGEEVVKKHALEMKPSRKRRIELLSESMEDEEDYLTFTEDGQNARYHWQTCQMQAAIPDNASEPYSPTEAIETPRMEPDEEMPNEAPSAEPVVEMPQDAPTIDSPPGLEEPMLQPSTNVMSGQPESEVTPVMSQQTSEVTSEEETIQPEPPAPAAGPTQLTQALRQGANHLDGLPRAHLADQEGSKNSNEVSYVEDKMDRFLAFAATRQYSKVKKKVKKAGAGREVAYEKEGEEEVR